MNWIQISGVFLGLINFLNAASSLKAETMSCPSDEEFDWVYDKEQRLWRANSVIEAWKGTLLFKSENSKRHPPLKVNNIKIEKTPRGWKMTCIFNPGQKSYSLSSEIGNFKKCTKTNETKVFCE